MSDWVSTQEAAEMLGARRNCLAEIAARNHWPKRWVKNRVFYPHRDVRRTVNIRAGKKVNGAMGSIPALRRIIRWADSLTAWPTDEEIEGKATVEHEVEMVRCILETRRYRGKPALEILDSEAL